MLHQFIEMTGYNRSHATGLLRNHGKRVKLASAVVLVGSVPVMQPTATCKSAYGPKEVQVLKWEWRFMDHICDKRIASQLSTPVPRHDCPSELKTSKACCEMTGRMSAARVAPLLEADRKKSTLKRCGGTKPGTLFER